MTVQEVMQALTQAHKAIGTPQQEQAHYTALKAVTKAYNEGIRLPVQANHLAAEIARAVILK